MSNAPTEKKTNSKGKYTRWLFLVLALGLLAIAEFVLEMDLGYPILGGLQVEFF